jgi:hypothetical protein
MAAVKTIATETLSVRTGERSAGLHGAGATASEDILGKQGSCFPIGETAGLMQSMNLPAVYRTSAPLPVSHTAPPLENTTPRLQVLIFGRYI